MTDDQTAESGSLTRAGFVALIGEPNAGKSTLLNRMVGAKVSIVTHKVQTTRARIRGVAMTDLDAGAKAQIVFIDTPGLFQPRRRLDQAMVSAAWTGASEADVVLLLIEAHRGVTEGVERILNELKEKTSGRNIALAINKIDRIKREKLLALTADIAARFEFEQVFYISAENGDGAEDLKRWLGGRMPESPLLYPEDDLSDLPTRMLAAEITREKLTLRLHQELPYQLTVETENWKDQKDGSARIEQIIYVAREGHKGIVLGKRGETIKAVGAEARTEIAELIDRPAHLFLTVIVRPNWLEENERFREMGLEPPGKG